MVNFINVPWILENSILSYQRSNFFPDSISTHLYHISKAQLYFFFLAYIWWVFSPVFALFTQLTTVLQWL